MTTGVATKVFLVDDHEVVRRGLCDVFTATDGIDVVGEAGTVADALAAIHECRPDVVVLDVRLPDGSGIDACRELTSTVPDVRCLMLSSHDDDETVCVAVLAGAAGYLLKDVRAPALVEAVRAVAAGRSLLDPALTDALLHRLRNGAEPAADPLAALSGRERQLLELIAEGLTNKQIAAQLFLAEKTVKNYVSALLAKLGYHRRTQIAALAATTRLPVRT